MRDVETLIIGAGISGLGTAAFLGRGADVLVLERDAAIGGYCKTVKKDGFVWDYSGHFFHFKHPELEAWLRARMPGQDLRTVTKKTSISYAKRWVDFPFQKNIHQLPQDEFIDCLYDLYFARAPGMASAPETNFKEMLYARFGRSIAEKFLIPYNEKLYATDLATLDRDAMGRFFPYAELTDVIRNMRQADNASYNASFTYPAGGAIEYVNAVASEVAPSAIHLEEPVEAIDLARRIARTSQGEYRYRRLVSTVPLPALLSLCGLPVDDTWAWNQVLVFNLGFDAKGPTDIHWLYVPNRERVFYRVGFYDNILDQPRMSLYVEVGFPRDARVDVAATRERVLADLTAEGLVSSQRLVAEHSVLMDPAYVHITSRSLAEVARLKTELAAQGVHSIGRYGGWTYCSIEDNLLEARRLATTVSGDPMAR
jgi:protoporphyrinogen oxidase